MLNKTLQKSLVEKELEMKIKEQKISFAQNTQGNHFIRVDGEEVQISVAHISKEQTKLIINGLANILSSIACYMD